jgi:hypothetical protein
MDEKTKKLKAKREKLESQLRELKRKEARAAASLSEQARKDDVRRKCLRSSWLEDLITRDREIHETSGAQFGARMMRELDRLWLIRDDDRVLFGLPILTDAEKETHPNAASIRKGGRKANPPPVLQEATGSGNTAAPDDAHNGPALALVKSGN